MADSHNCTILTPIHTIVLVTPIHASLTLARRQNRIVESLLLNCVELQKGGV